MFLGKKITGEVPNFAPQQEAFPILTDMMAIKRTPFLSVMVECGKLKHHNLDVQVRCIDSGGKLKIAKSYL